VLVLYGFIFISNGLKEEALLLAVEFGMLPLIQWLIKEEHANVKYKDPRNNGITPLLRAAHSGHLEIVSWLLNEGGSLMSEIDNDGATIVHYAGEIFILYLH
jgi:ankyrin repeat protein